MKRGRAIDVLACVLAAVGLSSCNGQTSPKILAKLPGPIGSEEADQATLHLLEGAGADLSKSTEVLFYLYFPDEGRALQAAEQARTAALSASVDRAALGTSWLCLVKGQMVPTLTAIQNETRRLDGIATSLGGEFDGWEAAVTR